MTPLIAHVKWFQDEGEAFVSPIDVVEGLIITVFVLIALFLLRRVQILLRASEEKIDSRMGRFTEFVAPAVGVTAGLGLIFAGLGRHFLAPNIEIGNSPFLLVALSVQLVVAVSWLLGLFTRFASGLFLALFALSFLFVDPVDLIDHLELAGAALYLGVCGRGRYSIDAMLGIDRKLRKPRQGLALLRTFTGMALIALAFSEKLLNLALSQDFLYEHQWNILQSAGVSDRIFIITMGSIELILGLMILLNILPRLSVVMIAGAMTVTAVILGPSEVPGHLFALGFALAILVNNKSETEPALQESLHRQC